MIESQIACSCKKPTIYLFHCAKDKDSSKTADIKLFAVQPWHSSLLYYTVFYLKFGIVRTCETVQRIFAAKNHTNEHVYMLN